MSCPICGQAFYEGQVCRRINNTVCICCCENCAYHVHKDYGDRCGYTSINKYDEIRKLMAKKDKLIKDANYYYKRNNPYLGDECIEEANVIKRKIEEMR